MFHLATRFVTAPAERNTRLIGRPLLVDPVLLHEWALRPRFKSTAAAWLSGASHLASIALSTRGGNIGNSVIRTRPRGKSRWLPPPSGARSRFRRPPARRADGPDWAPQQGWRHAGGELLENDWQDHGLSGFTRVLNGLTVTTDNPFGLSCGCREAFYREIVAIPNGAHPRFRQ